MFFVVSKNFLFFIICISVCFTATAEAQIRITEIFYNAEGSDAGKEFIEIKNTGNDIDISTLRLQIDDKNHLIKSENGDTTFDSGDVAVIVNNITDFNNNFNTNTTVFDSSFSLKNSESTIAITQDGDITHSVSYSSEDGASGDGLSLHIDDNNNISTKLPNPGSTSSSVVVQQREEPEEEEEEQPSVKKETQPVVKNVKPLKKIEDEYGLDINPYPIFSASDSTYEININGEKPLYGVWNFGDGNVSVGSSIVHQYLYPGTYVLYFQEEKRNFYKEELLSIQQEITVLFPSITISRINDEFIRVKNNHSFTLDISSWRILTNNETFIFPQYSFIQSKDSIAIPFISKETESIFFVTGGGGQFQGYEGIKPVSKKPSNIAPKKKDENVEQVTEKIEVSAPNNVVNKIEKEINDLEEFQKTKNNNNKYTPIIILLTFFGIFILLVAPIFLVKKEKRKNTRRRVRKIR